MLTMRLVQIVKTLEHFKNQPRAFQYTKVLVLHDLLWSYLESAVTRAQLHC